METSSEPPKVVMWLRIYAGFLCLLYLGVAALSLTFFHAGPRDLNVTREQAQAIGWAVLATGLVFSAVCVVPIFGPRRPWGWVYGLVIICLGMGCLITLPAGIPLLIHWIRPETKEWFATV